MSIFKAKEWWSNKKIKDTGTYTEGLLNYKSIKIDKFSSHSESDCLVVAEDSMITIYKPNVDDHVSSVILETQLSEPILQVETGKFTPATDDRQILLLHPQNYVIYNLQRKGGHTDVGDINTIHQVIKHSFTRKAHNVLIGPFGQIKTRDLICVQSLDGSLSFFDQDTFLFMCIFSDVIIPAPIAYVASSDNFVISKSTWVLEIYSYQQLRDFSELNIRQNKKNIPQWIYNAGEEISSVQVIQTSNNFSSIIALGERYLYCFQDNGLMKFIKKFDYTPMCFYPFLIGWYYEPSARLLVMVASDDCKLNIYDGPTLLWSCDLLHVPISISRCFLKSLPGGIVTLSNNGIVDICYLGTEPDLSPGGAPVVSDPVHPDKVHTDLEAAEEALQKIMENKHIEDDELKLDKILKIKAEAGKPVQNLIQQYTTQGENELHLLMCPVILMITCEEPTLLQAIQLTYVCQPPFSCADSTICLNSVNGTEIIETQVFVATSDDVVNPNVKVLITVTDAGGKISVLARNVLLPLSLYCHPNKTSNGDTQFEIETNKPCVDLMELCSEFFKEDFLEQELTGQRISLIYRTNNKTVTIKGLHQNYIIEYENLVDIAPILETLVTKLLEHSVRMNEKTFRLKLKVNKEIQTEVIHKFLKNIEVHAKERIKMKAFEKNLHILQKQFILIQKKLLVQYGSSPPGDCDALEFLMKDTYERLIKCAYNIMDCKENVCRAGNSMSAIGRILLYILKNICTDYSKISLAEEMLSLDSLYDDNQDWEESVTQGLTYVMNNVFKKSEKDLEKLAPVTEQGVLSHINLKRFLRQIRIILEKVFADIGEIDQDTNEGTDPNTRASEKRVHRIEELVEVL